MLRAITIHVEVSKWKLELTCGQDVDWLCGKNIEWVNYSKLLCHYGNRFVPRLIQFDCDTCESGLETTDEKEVSLVGIFRASVWGAELLDNVLTLCDSPVELEAVQRVEYIVIVIVSNHVKLLVAVDAELGLARKNVKSVDLTNLDVALQNGAGVCEWIDDIS